MTKFKVLFLLLTLSLGVTAQEISQENAVKKKEINKIKLSEEAVYADVMQDATSEEEAVKMSKSKSFSMLQSHVVETIAKDLNLSREKMKEIWSGLENKCHFIVVNQGEIFRVFTYIMRSDLNFQSESVPKVEEIDTIAVVPVVVDTLFISKQKTTETEINVQPAVVDTIVVSQPNVAEQTIEKEPKETYGDIWRGLDALMPKDSLEVKKDVEVAIQSEDSVLLNSSVINSTVNNIEIKEEFEPTTKVEVVIPELCQKILEKVKFQAVMRFLTQEKTYQRLMYGNSSTMQYPEKCYVVIFDKSTQEIVSLLDKGQRERLNFVTNEVDRFSNYKKGNYTAVFVQEY